MYLPVCQKHCGITFAILETAGRDKEGATKMQIMAAAFITYETATGYLEKLVQEGLIQYQADTRTYSTTKLGKERILPASFS